MVASFLNIVTLCPQAHYDIVQGDLVIIGINPGGMVPTKVFPFF